MAKKSERAEPKKECPSCGLGVTEQAMVCEFCGWDFNEEDEWILQIEKLERDLMLEKQRYEPGTVNHMIESTLRSAVVDRIEPSTPVSEEAVEIEEPSVEVEGAEPEELFEVEPTPPTRRAREERVVETAPTKPPKVRRVRSIKEPKTQPASQRYEREPEPAYDEPPVSAPAAAPVRQRAVRRVRTEAEPPPMKEAAEPPQAETASEDETPVRRVRAVKKVKR
ncbi:MAG: hypothetical protein OEM29_02020 [Thermoplasmata archaeon]|nr:hypothetical protein [Thermoplasmata archaeon]